MVKRYFILIVTQALILFSGCRCSSESGAPNREVVSIKGESFSLELAVDDATRTRGLGGRVEIPDEGGMLFVFPDAGQRSFWMYDCETDIDLIFLDTVGRITALHAMPREAPRGENETEQAYQNRLAHYWSGSPAQFAIELAPGSIARLGLQVEEKIKLDLPRLKALPR